MLTQTIVDTSQIYKNEKFVVLIQLRAVTIFINLLLYVKKKFYMNNRIQLP